MPDSHDTHAGYAVILEPAADGGFGVYVPDLPGCVSEGDTPEQALANIREAIHGHLATLRDFGETIPPPRSTTATVLAGCTFINNQ